MKNAPKLILKSTVVGGCWAIIIGGLWMRSIDPLTGFGLKGYLNFILIHFLLASIVGFCVFKQLKILASLLIMLGLLFGIPFHSKGGVEISIQNDSDTTRKFKVSRYSTSIELMIAPNQVTKYTTAPGDYSESEPMVFLTRSSELKVLPKLPRRIKLHISQDGGVKVK